MAIPREIDVGRGYGGIGAAPRSREVERGGRGARGYWCATDADRNAHRPGAVVAGAAGGIAEHLVGLVELLDPCFRVLPLGIQVRMVVAHQPAVGIADLSLACGRRHPKDGVVILLRHGSASPLRGYQARFSALVAAGREPTAGGPWTSAGRPDHAPARRGR